MKLQIEIASEETKSITSYFDCLGRCGDLQKMDTANNLSDKKSLVGFFQNLLPSLKIGFGGSHIWFANDKNERVAIIYLA